MINNSKFMDKLNANLNIKINDNKFFKRTTDY